jgi:hypothetical protein
VTACRIEKFFGDLTAARDRLTDEQRATMDERFTRARSLFGGSEAIEHFSEWRTPEEHLEEAKRKLWWRADDL